jgi:predicted deacylase
MTMDKTLTGKSRVWTPVDFEADGKQVDCLRVPHSTDLSAYGWVPVPLVCIRNGDGPTALLIAGNHGDEYEGQVALLNLARAIEPRDVNGRIIILPALNYPAVQAGRRVSPLDDANLNRIFPGNPFGSPSEMIAHYLCEVLLPKADFVVDLHSGGCSLHYVPSTLIRPGRTEAEHEQLIKLTRLFGAPISCISDGAGGGGGTTLAAAAQDCGVVALTTELGGAAMLGREGLQVAEAGLRRLLGYHGIVPGLPVEPAPPTRMMRVSGRDAFVYARSRGIFEPAAEPGEEIAAGQVAGRVHCFEGLVYPPQTLYFPRAGLVACRRVPALVDPGDCLFKIVIDMEQAELVPPFR